MTNRKKVGRFKGRFSYLLIFIMAGLLLLSPGGEIQAGDEFSRHQLSFLQDELRLGVTAERVREVLGQPARIDPTPYYYDCWIYNQDYDNYFQIGIRDGQVVTIYSNSLNWGYKDARVGRLISEVKNTFSLKREIEFEYEEVDFTIDGSNEDDSVYLYLDQQQEEATVLEILLDIHDNHRITSIIISDIKTTLAKGNYHVSYSYFGEEPEFGAENLSLEQQEEVDRALERQFLDLINSVRVRKDLHTLDWNQQLADVALSHSQDMSNTGFFAHESPNTGGVGDRVSSANIHNEYALENIARGQADAIRAHEGLMNSKGHRENILSDNILELGAGAYQSDYYTQKFILTDSAALEERKRGTVEEGVVTDDDFQDESCDTSRSEVDIDLANLYEAGKRVQGEEEFILKWPAAKMPIEVSLYGDYSSASKEVVDNILADLSAVSSDLNLRRVEEETDFTIYFVPARDFSLYRDSIQQETSEWHWAWYVNWQNYQLWKADLFIASEKNLSLQQIEEYLRMNLIRALGLPNTEFRNYTAEKLALLEFLYQNELESGINWQELKEF